MKLIFTIKSYLVILLILLSFTIQAQKKDTSIIKNRNNIATLNVGGEGFTLGLTASFEKSFINTNWFHLGLGIGAGRTWGTYQNRFCFPTYLNIKLGKKKHFFEINGGVNHLVDFNYYPKTKAERTKYLDTHDYYSDNFNGLNFSIDSFRPPYVPSYFLTANYVLKSKNGFVFKIGCTGSKTNLEFIYPPIYWLSARLSFGYAF